MQVSLYAQFAPNYIPLKPRKIQNVDKNDHHLRNDQDQLRDVSRRDDHSDSASMCSLESNFLTFLKKSSFVPFELALNECGKRNPPLFLEIIYILGRLGKTKEALGLLLREVQDVKMAIEFVESHDKQLWVDVVNHSLLHADFLTALMDHLGICSLNPINLISQIGRKTEIHFLRQRLLRITNQFKFQVDLNDKCNIALEEDMLSSQRLLNQSRRRAMKVKPTVRCTTCARPLFMPAPVRTGLPVEGGIGTITASSSQIGSDDNTIKNDDSKLGNTGKDSPKIGTIWGNVVGEITTGLVVYSDRSAYHRSCYDITFKS
jgi:hypothetical protein